MSRAAGGGWRAAVVLLAFATGLAVPGCGKKGDPEPPLPRGPNAVTSLAVEQEGDDAILTFPFPDRLMNGAPLTDLASIEVYRVDHAPPGLTAPRRSAAGPAPSATSGQSTTTTVTLPGTAERRAATNVRMAEETFYGAASKIATLSLPDIAESTRGASVVYRDPLSPMLLKEGKPAPMAYAVISVRRGGERSPLSNIVGLTPDIAPDAPTLGPAYPEEGRVCLEWSPAERDVLGLPVEVSGYNVYRRIYPQDEYETPLNAKPVAGLSYVDASAPYGAPLVYTVRAILAKNPKVEGLPADELTFIFRDIYPPGPPTRLDALSEGTLVRLVWTPVDAADLAGYLVFRAEGDGPWVRLTSDALTDPFYADPTAAQGRRYRYTVRAVDRAGNQSPPSPEAVAEPF